MMQYHVDNSKMAHYIKRLDIRRTIVFVIIILAVISIVAFILSNIDRNFPSWILIIAAVGCSVAFYFALKAANKGLKQLANGQYFIENSLLRFEGTEHLTREFKLDEIAVIHKKYSGTLVIKGNGWTKFDYIRPKRSNPYQPGGPNVIFIPKITSNYAQLTDTIKLAATNAMKL